MIFKDRHLQVRLVSDQERPTGAPPIDPVTYQLDPERIIETATVGVATVLVVNRVAGLVCNAIEHIVVTKIK